MRAEHQDLVTKPPEVRPGISTRIVYGSVIRSQGINQDDHDVGSRIVIPQAYGGYDRGHQPGK